MGSLVSREQLDNVKAGLAELRGQADVLHDGASAPLVDADPAIAACIGPVLLGTRSPATADRVHAVEVFGPVATLMPYDGLEQAYDFIRRGEGSLVASVYSADAAQIAETALALADSHGRVHAISPEVAAVQTGHGNVMPMSLHGGPGRAGGGEELGGLRALGFYHRRSAIQAETAVIDAVTAASTPFAR